MDKLEVATEALKHYARRSNWQLCRTEEERHRHYAFVADGDSRMFEGYEVAEKALKQILDETILETPIN